MRILYGVTGEGLGHAMRSRVIAEHLRQRGHTVQLVASGRARGYLARYFPDVEEIPGFTLAYARCGIARMQTLRSNYRAARGAILRREVLDLEPTTGDHVLVYQTATRDLVEPLAALPEHKFVVYGCGPGQSAHAHITFRPFDETQFLADLASARAVICNGGYTLM